MRTSRFLRAAAVLAVAGAIAACAPVVGEAETPLSPSPTASPAPPAPTPAVSVPVTSATVPPVEAVAAPVRLSVPDLGVDMSIQPVGVQDDGSMEIPADPAIAGWYRFGSAPSTGEGATVLAAHVDSRIYGLGPLSALRDAQAGWTISVTAEDGTASSYVVESVTYIPRAQLPVDQLFSRTGPASLVLITCGGTFDEQRRSYSDNVVLVATAVA